MIQEFVERAISSGLHFSKVGYCLAILSAGLHFPRRSLGSFPVICLTRPKQNEGKYICALKKGGDLRNLVSKESISNAELNQDQTNLKNQGFKKVLC